MGLGCRLPRRDRAENVGGVSDLQTILAEIKAREAAATPEPWHVQGRDDDGKGQFIVQALTAVGCDEDDNEHGTVGNTVFQNNDVSYGYSCNYHDNAEFIAHARTDLPRLVKALEKAIAQRDTYVMHTAIAEAVDSPLVDSPTEEQKATVRELIEEEIRYNDAEITAILKGEA